MDTGTKILIAGLGALGVVLVVKHQADKATAALPAGPSAPAQLPPSPAPPLANITPASSPEVLAAQQAAAAAAGSPEALAAQNFAQQAANALSQAFSPSNASASASASDIVRQGDVVNVDLFKAGMAVPIPLAGNVVMSVDSLNVQEDIHRDKFIGSFLAPELRASFGPQVVNRNAITSKV